MRIVLYLLSALLFYACNNDVTSIGQDLVQDKSYVEAVEYWIDQTYTIQLDSFPTNESKDNVPKNMVFGKVNDPVSGMTTATPYVMFESTPLPTIERYYVYDSITLTLGVKRGNTWGDTTRIQKFYLHQLKEIPQVNAINSYIYSNRETPYEATPLDSIRFLPYATNTGKMVFRLNDALGLELYEMVRNQDINISTSEINPSTSINFLKYFKGLAFVPDEENNCLMGLYANADTFSIQVHYHNEPGTALRYSIRKSLYFNSFTYTHLANNSAATPYTTLTGQTDLLHFADAKTAGFPYGQVISQGLNGYMIKMRLPVEPTGDIYKTIVKAEIVLKTPFNSNANNFHDLSTIYVYASDKENKLLGMINVNEQTVSGNLSKNIMQPDDSQYVINITDYYNLLCKDPNGMDNNHIIIGISSGDFASSFHRMVINELPILRIYYAKYE